MNNSIIILGALALGAWYFLSKDKEDKKTEDGDTRKPATAPENPERDEDAEKAERILTRPEVLEGLSFDEDGVQTWSRTVEV